MAKKKNTPPPAFEKDAVVTYKGQKARVVSSTDKQVTIITDLGIRITTLASEVSNYKEAVLWGKA